MIHIDITMQLSHSTPIVILNWLACKALVVSSTLLEEISGEGEMIEILQNELFVQGVDQMVSFISI